jgi:hypothetical protein
MTVEEHDDRRDLDDLLRRAVANIGTAELRAALDLATQPAFRSPKAIRNAMLALRRHHDPAPFLARPQYRHIVPYLAAALSDNCLTRTIEVLGDHSEDPTRDQLLGALDAVRPDFTDAVMAVMLAGVAHDELPAFGLCIDLLATDPRYGLAGTGGGAPAEGAAGPSS